MSESESDSFTHTHTQLYLGAGLNLSGSILRYVSTFHPIVCSSVFSKSGFMVAMIGQILTACAQPFMLYAPTKLASFWFGPKERAVCTNFASIGIIYNMTCEPTVVIEVTHTCTHTHAHTHAHAHSQSHWSCSCSTGLSIHCHLN